jgi:hypothetical protein
MPFTFLYVKGFEGGLSFLGNAVGIGLAVVIKFIGLPWWPALLTLVAAILVRLIIEAFAAAVAKRSRTD